MEIKENGKIIYKTGVSFTKNEPLIYKNGKLICKPGFSKYKWDFQATIHRAFMIVNSLRNIVNSIGKILKKEEK